MNLTKQSLPKIMTSVWVIGIVTTGFLLSVPPDDVPIYIGLACIGAFPLVLGSRRYQIFGVVAVSVSLTLAYLDYKAGLRIIHTRIERLEMMKQENQATNVIPGQSAKP